METISHFVIDSWRESVNERESELKAARLLFLDRIGFFLHVLVVVFIAVQFYHHIYLAN